MATAPQRYVARPVEVEAITWAGDFDALPGLWQAHPLIRWTGTNLKITTIEGFTGYPVIGDYLVWGTASELYWAPPDIWLERWKPVEGIRWVALPVVTEAAPWTGVFDDLPEEWQDDPHMWMDATQRLALVTHRGAISHPRIGDYIVPRTTGKWSWVPKAIFEYKYEAI